jgi:hypothetical protein
MIPYLIPFWIPGFRFLFTAVRSIIYEQKFTNIHHPTGGNDVFVDIGDKSWGVRACQRYFGGIDAAHTLHVGDQFLSAGANDFKVRLPSFACVMLLELLGENEHG